MACSYFLNQVIICLFLSVCVRWMFMRVLNWKRRRSVNITMTDFGQEMFPNLCFLHIPIHPNNKKIFCPKVLRNVCAGCCRLSGGLVTMYYGFHEMNWDYNRYCDPGISSGLSWPSRERWCRGVLGLCHGEGGRALVSIFRLLPFFFCIL